MPVRTRIRVQILHRDGCRQLRTTLNLPWRHRQSPWRTVGNGIVAPLSGRCSNGSKRPRHSALSSGTPLASASTASWTSGESRNQSARSKGDERCTHAGKPAEDRSRGHTIAAVRWPRRRNDTAALNRHTDCATDCIIAGFRAARRKQMAALASSPSRTLACPDSCMVAAYSGDRAKSEAARITPAKSPARYVACSRLAAAVIARPWTNVVPLS